jgi:hypothetical protein
MMATGAHMTGKRLISALVFCIGLTAAPPGRPISDRLARHLVREALASKGIASAGVVLVPYVNNSAPDFYSYQAMRRNSSAPGSFGFFGVNSRTGDVWSFDTCERISSPALEKEIESIVRRSGLSESAVRILRDSPPGCRPDIDPKSAP